MLHNIHSISICSYKNVNSSNEYSYSRILHNVMYAQEGPKLDIVCELLLSLNPSFDSNSEELCPANSCKERTAHTWQKQSSVLGTHYSHLKLPHSLFLEPSLPAAHPD